MKPWHAVLQIEAPIGTFLGKNVENVENVEKLHFVENLTEYNKQNQFDV